MDHQEFRRALQALMMPLLLGFASLAAQSDPAFIVGRKVTIESKQLGERREILLDVPQAPAKAGWPLLVVLDGEWHFKKVSAVVEHLVANGRLPPMVIAGVVNRDRGRDLDPVYKDGEFAPGGSERFLSFLADELIPHLEATYPIGKCRILAGHSNAGMFSLYALIRRPEVFQANLALSPSFGMDDRFVANLGRALAKLQSPRFVFIGAGGDEEADISVGALRFAKTFEGIAPQDLEYHYESFPKETHGSVTFRAFYRALELLGQADTPVPEGPGHLLSEAQLRRRAWIRRFGSTYSDEPLPMLSAARPLLGAKDLPAAWGRLRAEFGADFRFDAVETQNLLNHLEVLGRKDAITVLRKLPDFNVAVPAEELNNYGRAVDLKAGLALKGSPGDLSTRTQGAVPCADRHGREGKAFRFDGKGSFIEAPGVATSGSLTVSAWIRPHMPAAYSAWISQCRSTWGSQWRLGFGTNPAVQWGPTILAAKWTDYWVSGEGLPVDRWVHTTAVFDQTLGELHLYVDGKALQTFSGLSPWVASQGPLLIGAQRDDGIYFQGDIGEIRIYKRALSATEVDALSKVE